MNHKLPSASFHNAILLSSLLLITKSIRMLCSPLSVSSHPAAFHQPTTTNQQPMDVTRSGAEEILHNASIPSCHCLHLHTRLPFRPPPLTSRRSGSEGHINFLKIHLNLSKLPSVRCNSCSFLSLPSASSGLIIDKKTHGRRAWCRNMSTVEPHFPFHFIFFRGGKCVRMNVCAHQDK